jgi:hypothetical protein
MAPGRSSGNSLAIIVFRPSPVGYGTQVNECCIKSRDDLIVHHPLSSSCLLVSLSTASMVAAEELQE